MRRRLILAPAAALSALLVLSGCMGGGMGPYADPDGAPTQVDPYDQSDVHFTMMMIPHHEQAIEMSGILLDADGIDAELTDLAERITAAQAPEIEFMRAWLDARGLPDSDGMGDMPGNGMMSDDELDDLRALDGDAAEVLFLTAMIEHHRGAIEMAQDEIAAGRDAEIIALCGRIVESQTAEIAEMETLLAAR